MKCKEYAVETKVMGMLDVGKFGKEKSYLRDVSINDLLGRGSISLDNDEIKQYINNKVVMVTGAGGSIGSELCRQIVKCDPKCLICFDIYENNLYNLEQELNNLKQHAFIDKKFTFLFLIGSFRDKKRVDQILSFYKPSILFHAAAHKHVPLMETAPQEAIKNNIFGTYNTLTSCINNKVEKFVLISTDKAVNLTNVMGVTKRMCELIIQAYRNNGTTKMGAVRFGNVLGSNGSVIPFFKEQIKNGGPVTVTDENITRFFMTIPEAAQLVLQAACYAKNGDIFVLDMGEPVKILKLAEDLIRVSNLEPYKDIDIIFTGLRPGEKMYEELSLTTEKRLKTENDLIYINESTDLSIESINEKLEKLRYLLDENNSIVIRDEL